MNYHLIRNARRRERLGVWLPLLFIGIAVLLHFFYPSLLGEFASRIAAPLWRAERVLRGKSHTFSLFLSSKEALTEEVDRLSIALEESRRLLLDRELLREENRLLREQWGSSAERSGRIVGAILAAPPRSPYDSVILDVGAHDGVEAGSLALSGSAVLGTVSNVYERTARVELFSAAGRKSQVSILHGGKAIPAEATGQGGGAFIALLPKGVGLAIGDDIVMPGFNHLLFAVVEHIESTEAESFQYVRFKNPVSLQTLRILEIRPGALTHTP